MNLLSNRIVLLGLALAIGLIAIVQNYFGFYKYVGANRFWDLNVYQIAVDRYNSGLNAYETNGALLFIYHPIVLHFFSLLGEKFKFFAQASYFVICAIALARFFKNKKYIFPFFIGFSFLGLGILSFETGNVTFFLHLILVILLFSSLASKVDVLLFLLMVALCSLIKPYMIAYILIPILVAFRRGENLREVTKQLVIIIGVLLFLLMAHSAFFYDLFVGFYEALKTQTLIRGDVGLSLAGYLSLKHVSGISSLGLHFVFILMIAIVIFGYFYCADSENEAAFIMALYFIFTALNPRLKEYDIPVLMFALFAASIFIAKSISDWIFIFVANCFPLLHFFVKNGLFARSEWVIFLSVSTIFCFFIKKLCESRGGKFRLLNVKF